MEDYVARTIAVLGLITSISKILYDVWKDSKRINIRIDQALLTDGCQVLGITIHNKSNYQLTILGAGILFYSGTVMANGEVDTRITKRKIKWLENRQAIPIEFPIKIILGDPIRIAYPLSEILQEYKKGDKIEMIYCFDSERKIYSCKLPGVLNKWIKSNL